MNVKHFDNAKTMHLGLFLTQTYHMVSGDLEQVISST